jgi:hypothetical protein
MIGVFLIVLLLMLIDPLNLNKTDDSWQVSLYAFPVILYVMFRLLKE